MATILKPPNATSEPEVLTFGCRLNAYESEVMRAEAIKAGLSDAIIVNTCAVTAEAERQARQTIRKKRRENPGARIIVTGCAAQIDPAKFAAMAEVDHVLGNAEKMKAASYAALGQDDAPRLQITDIMELREAAGHLIDNFEGHARAFIEVQQGCDHRCTFCIIPYGRGNSRSLPMGDIVNQVKRLVGNGYNEIVLSGVDITSYGPDLPGAPKLGQMVRRLLANVPELARLRLSSIDVAEIEGDADLMELIAHEPRLMPHLHLSLQAGDDMILKRMKRRHSRQQAVKFCAKVRALRPDMAFGADLIAGFPTETDEMFENSLKLVEDCGLAYLHVFPFSARASTPAARMPQLPMPVRKARAARLRGVGEIARDAYLARFVGRTVSAIMETETLGRSEEFAAVSFAQPQTVGRIVRARVSGLSGGKLIAESLQ
ncbi:MAG TPA: tRNA (N(6)-L-threonylcarbamoyladenosine(37)-C(2))-methylthiotransferase MtaB [Alphaproteobacteria bacterium]